MKFRAIPQEISYHDWQALKIGGFTEAWGNNPPKEVVALAKNEPGAARKYRAYLAKKRKS